MTKRMDEYTMVLSPLLTNFREFHFRVHVRLRLRLRSCFTFIASQLVLFLSYITFLWERIAWIMAHKIWNVKRDVQFTLKMSWQRLLDLYIFFSFNFWHEKFKRNYWICTRRRRNFWFWVTVYIWKERIYLTFDAWIHILKICI